MRILFKKFSLYFIIAGILFELFFGLGILVTDKIGSVHTLDTQVASYMAESRTDGMNDVMRFVTHLGDYQFILHMAVVIGLLLAVFGNIELSLGVIASLSLTHYFTSIFKHFFHRFRPEDAISRAGGWAYPSGHASGSAILAFMVIWAAYIVIPHRVTRISVISLAVIYAVSVSLSRVYLGVHWVSDVVGGTLLALAVGVLMMAVLKPVIMKRKALC